MLEIDASSMEYRALNDIIRQSADDVTIRGCLGQRYIGSGQQSRTITVHGTPGNALGAYLDGATIKVIGNAQDAVGDTMNAGDIIIHGHAGDALGYAMRGGRIIVRDDAGYRTGIHMKEYQGRRPTLVVGGRVGSFLGEYLAGGLIIVLGLGIDDPPIGNFTGTGMHGGRIYIRTNHELANLPAQVAIDVANASDIEFISSTVYDFCQCFNLNAKTILSDRFYVLKPNAKNPYRQMYTPN